MNVSKVIILLATYNGEDFLVKQLDSLIAQTHTNWELWVSDDGSTDATIALLHDYQQRLGVDKVHILSGPRKGFAANFLSLIGTKQANGDYYAYCDQDDEWEPTKLEKGLQWLDSLDKSKAALYCSRTKLVDEQGMELGYSPLFTKAPSFLNALVQNIAGGNTMIFNHTALDLLRTASDKALIVSHDWWTYLVVTGAGGLVYYDPQSLINYRQHSANLVGSNSDWQARFARIFMLFQGRLRQWNDMNIKALLDAKHVLTPENRTVLHNFAKARDSSFFLRPIKAKLLGIYRQTFFGNVGLAIATLFKKI